MALNHQAALVVPTPLGPRPRTGVNPRRGSQARDQLSRRLRYLTLRTTAAKQILPIAAIAVGLVASVAWTAFLCFELAQLVGPI